MKEVVLQLSWLDLVFLIIAIVSLVFNDIQRREHRSFRLPLSNALVALFNDVKSKSNHVLWVQQLIYSTQSPHSELATLKLEYAQFAQTVLNHMWGFQESIVGVLVTLTPSDRDGRQTFRATDYGLTDQEKQWRMANAERLRQQELNQQAAAKEKTKQQSEIGGGGS